MIINYADWRVLRASFRLSLLAEKSLNSEHSHGFQGCLRALEADMWHVVW